MRVRIPSCHQHKWGIVSSKRPNIVRDYNVCQVYDGTPFSGIGGNPEFYRYENQLDTYWIAKLLPIIRKQGTVVDVGCGFGRLTNLFSSKGFETIGVDVSVGAITIAKNQSQRSLGQEAHYIVGSAHDLPLRSSISELTCCVRILPILAAAGLLEESVAELSRITISHGKLLFIELFPRRGRTMTPFAVAVPFRYFKNLLEKSCSILHYSGLSGTEKFRLTALYLREKALEKRVLRPLAGALFDLSLRVSSFLDVHLSGAMTAISDRKIVFAERRD
jgi:ubiquinone/menaquinone biosynthesis C-methylase UbiE